MSRKQLENEFATSSASITTPVLTRIARLRSKTIPKTVIRFPSFPNARPRPGCTPILLPIDVDELEKMEMGKSRPIPEDT